VKHFHIIGNGLSLLSLKDELLLNSKDTEERIGCNFGHSDIETYANVVIDIKPFRFNKFDSFNEKPLLITKRIFEYLELKDKLSKVNILEVIDNPIKLEKISYYYSMNAGQVATLYAINNKNATHITLWGFDVLINKSIATSTDENFNISINRDLSFPFLHRIWINYWNYIFQEYKGQVAFTIKGHAKNHE
jgi:hypothetical protein